MGRQSSRIYFNGQDHKEMVTWDGSKYQYHDKAYIWNGNSFELVWEKLDDEFTGIATPIEGLKFGFIFRATDPLYGSWMPRKMGNYFVGRDYDDTSKIIKINIKTKEKTLICVDEPVNYDSNVAIGFTNNQTIQTYRSGYVSAYNILTGNVICSDIPGISSQKIGMGTRQNILSPNQGITSKMLIYNGGNENAPYMTYMSMPENTASLGEIFIYSGNYYKCISIDSEGHRTFIQLQDLSNYFPKYTIRFAPSGSGFNATIQNRRIEKDSHYGYYYVIALKDFNTMVAIHQLVPMIALYSIPDDATQLTWDDPYDISDEIELEGYSQGYYGSSGSYYYNVVGGHYIAYRISEDTGYLYDYINNKTIKIELPTGVSFSRYTPPYFSISPDENLILVRNVSSTDHDWRFSAFHIYNRKKRKWYHFKNSDSSDLYIQQATYFELPSNNMVVAGGDSSQYGRYYQVYKLT